MLKPTQIRNPRDVMRWLAAAAEEEGAELHAGIELGVEGMVQPPTPGDQAEVQRYMRENQKIEAAVKRLCWLEYGPFANEETYVLTERGADEIAALVSFDDGLRQLRALVELELRERVREFALRTRTARHEAAAVGATTSGRARIQMEGLATTEVEFRRRVLVEVAIRLSERLGGRRLEQAEQVRLTDSLLAMLPIALTDIEASVPTGQPANSPRSHVLDETPRLRFALQSAFAAPSRQSPAVPGDVFHIQADGSQVNAGGAGNTVVMVQEIPAGLLDRIGELESELLKAGAEELAESVRELRLLAKRGETPVGLWKGLLKQLGRGAQLAGAAEDGFALSDRARDAATIIAEALGLSG